MIRRRYLVLQRWSLDRVLLCESPLRGLFARPAPSDADAVVVLACCGVGVKQVVHQLGKHPAEMCCGNDAGNATGGRSREFCCRGARCAGSLPGPPRVMLTHWW